MRYYLICFTNEENDSEKLRNFPIFVKAGSGGPPPPVPTPNIIWSHVDPVPPFSPSVPISCMLSFDSALSLDSRICSSNPFLANLTFLDPHAFHNPQPAQHSPQVPPCPLWSYTGVTDSGLLHRGHWQWAGRRPSPGLTALTSHLSPCLAVSPGLFSPSLFHLFQTTLVSSLLIPQFYSCLLLLTFCWRLCFLFHWRSSHSLKVNIPILVTKFTNLFAS